MTMKYWLDLFTGTTWEEFRKSGANVSGFSDRMRKNVERMAAGDVLLCDLTGVMRWVGALEVLGASQEKGRIWKDAEFPARVAVKALVMLSPENGVPMGELEGKVSFYESKADPRLPTKSERGQQTCGNPPRRCILRGYLG